MFCLGLLLGVVGTFGLVLWLGGRIAEPPTSSIQARAAIRDLEQRTLQELLQTELAAQHHRHQPVAGTDIIESTAREVET